ncbi:hypothetical protein DPMN_100966 [Dreissena polymorpha]|uniref:Uncharacterized protein n=1 Tax=Dreissena polymorpha TaxID=45954 RepID=A0A9D4R8P2_DREPO|nr:hypothetical protein DPMN_100966 [Dreissena polymorpha]
MKISGCGNHLFQADYARERWNDCCNNGTMQTYLGGAEVTQGVDPVSGHTPTEQEKSQVLLELTHHQPHQSSQQSHATHHSTRLKSKTEELLAEKHA